MACPFIQICAPIYNGVSPCSTFAHKKLTTISYTRERSSCASIQIATKWACCAAQATQTGWSWDGPSMLTAPTAARRGCPERACGINTTLVQLPEYGPGVRCRAPGRVAPDVRMRPLPDPGVWQSGVGIQWDGTICMTAHRFGSSPHPSPGALLPLACLPRTVSACLSCPLLRLSAPPSLHCTSLSACRGICTRGWCAKNVLLEQCGECISTSPGKVIKQEITCRL